MPEESSLQSAAHSFLPLYPAVDEDIHYFHVSSAEIDCKLEAHAFTKDRNWIMIRPWLQDTPVYENI